MAKFTVKDFFRRFPNDQACLDHVMNVRFGMRHTCQKCQKDSTFHHVEGRRAYACASCGNHLYPCAGTIFEDSRTKLQLWFYAIFLFVVTRHGVSGKELERQLGVTYKTAWRMGHQIRLLAGKADFHAKLVGHIEVDEAYIGGHQAGKRGRGASNKTIVVGMQERSGPIKTKVVPNVRTISLRGVVLDNVERGSIVSTDELSSYALLSRDGYNHGAVRHAAGEYVRGNTHVNSVEGFWKLFKDSISSTHIHVSRKYMERYLGEFTFRSNHRGHGNAMFDLLIAAV
jgi:transposase-like protein